MASLKPRKTGRKKERKKAYAVSLSRLTLSTSEEKETLPNQLTPKLVIAGNITDIYPTPRRQKQHREKEKKTKRDFFSSPSHCVVVVVGGGGGMENIYTQATSRRLALKTNRSCCLPSYKLNEAPIGRIYRVGLPLGFPKNLTV
jgi:hypothetical protein